MRGISYHNDYLICNYLFLDSVFALMNINIRIDSCIVLNYKLTAIMIIKLAEHRLRQAVIIYKEDKEYAWLNVKEYLRHR